MFDVVAVAVAQNMGKQMGNNVKAVTSHYLKAKAAEKQTDIDRQTVRQTERQTEQDSHVRRAVLSRAQLANLHLFVYSFISLLFCVAGSI